MGRGSPLTRLIRPDADDDFRVLAGDAARGGVEALDGVAPDPDDLRDLERGVALVVGVEDGRRRARLVRRVVRHTPCLKPALVSLSEALRARPLKVVPFRTATVTC